MSLASRVVMLTVRLATLATTGALLASLALPANAQERPSVNVGSHIELDFTARFDADVRLATDAIGMDGADVDLDHRRVGVEGSIAKSVDFQVERDLVADGSWRDVFVNVRHNKAFEVQAGRFKIPFGREALQSGKNIDFVRRALISTQLAPGRDTGIMAHGRLAGRRLRYSAGFFGGGGDNSRTSTTEGAGRTIAGRVVFVPLTQSGGSTDGRLQIGAGVTDDDLRDVLGLRGRTAFGDDVFFDRVYVNGRRLRYGVDAVWNRGPVSLSSEYMAVTDARRGMGVDGQNLDPVHAGGWYLAATWALTGEDKSGRLEPRRNVPHGPGAIELVLRVEQLRFGAVELPAGKQVSTNADQVTTAGLNWNLNHYLRLQGNLVMESVDDPERSPAPTTIGRFIGAVFRLQFSL